MPKYSTAPANEAKAAKSKGSNVKVHFKNSVEVVHAIRGMSIARAKSYLENVLEHKEAIPFQRFKGGRGRHAQAKNLKVPGSLVGWPKNAVKAVLNLLLNAESNAETKGLDLEKTTVSHSHANQAPKGRRRTYRAHGRINAYMSVPAHLEVILVEKPEEVAAAPEEVKPRLHKRRLARRLPIKEGGGVTAE